MRGLLIFAAVTAVELSLVIATAWAIDERWTRRAGGRLIQIVKRTSDQWWQQGARADRIVFDLDFESLQKIRFDRERALMNGINFSSENFWVPATLTHGDRVFDVKLRLKGAHPDHWNAAEKWSYHVTVRGDRTFKGMKRFSIQHPQTRGYLYEWLFQRALRDEGLISSRFDFLEVVINGENQGIFALEERVGKRLLENNGRREGPIVGFDKNIWLHFPIQDRAHHGIYESAEISVPQSASIERNSPAAEAYLKAISLLEAFRTMELPASSVFDIEQLAKLAALHAAFGAYEFDWKDLKFYYNPFIARLVPIGREMARFSQLPVPGWWLNDDPWPHQKPFYQRLFDDPEFLQAYLRYLDSFSRPDYLEALLARHGRDLAKRMAILSRELSSSKLGNPADELAQTRRRIRSFLRPRKALHAHYAGFKDGLIELEIGVIQHFPLKVTRLATARGESFEPTEQAMLGGKETKDMVRYQTVRFKISPGAGWSEEKVAGLTLHYRVPGLEGEGEGPVSPWVHSVKSYVESELPRAPSSLPQVPYLVTDEARREIHCRAGAWEIREPIVVSAGYSWHCQGGVHWDLRDGAFVLSYSPVFFEGSEERPIVIQSSDHTGQGLAILEAGRESVLSHVWVRGLSAPSHAGWSLTGAITFYESPVRIEHCSFTDNQRGDDMLNLFRSEFILRDAQFLRTRADALDADFSDGEISRVFFREAGNDAIDSSASRISIRDVVIDGANDKGLSSGEGSVTYIDRLGARNTRIALASKDDAYVDISNSSFSSSEIGFAVYRKKPEFGPGSIRAVGLKLTNVQRPYLVEQGSSLLQDGVKAPDDQRNLKALLYEDE